RRYPVLPLSATIADNGRTGGASHPASASVALRRNRREPEPSGLQAARVAGARSLGTTVAPDLVLGNRDGRYLAHLAAVELHSVARCDAAAERGNLVTAIGPADVHAETGADPHAAAEPHVAALVVDR